MPTRCYAVSSKVSPYPEMALRPYRQLMLRSRRNLYSLFDGRHLTPRGDGGLEFREIREYQPGDSPRRINWRATARSRRPVVNLTQPSRRLEAKLVYACGGSMAYGTLRPKHESAVELLTLLAGIAEASHDRIEALLYDDAATRWLLSRRSRRVAETLYHTLAAHDPVGCGVSPRRCVETLLESFPRRSLLYLVGDFLEPWHLEELSARHEVILLILRDPGELKPALLGRHRILDPVTGEITELEIDTPALRHYETQRRKRDLDFEAQLRRLGILHRTILNDEDPVDALAELLRKGGA